MIAVKLDLLGPFSPLGGDGLDALGWPPLGDPLTPKLVLVAAGPQVAPELGQNIAPCVGGALVRR